MQKKINGRYQLYLMELNLKNAPDKGIPNNIIKL